MSGPKSTQYRLSEQRRRQIEAELAAIRRRREEEEKRRLEQERIRKEKQRIAASIEERCQNQTMQLDILRDSRAKAEEIGEWTDDTALIQEAKTIEDLVLRLKSTIGASESEDLEILREKSRKCDEAIENIKGRLREYSLHLESASEKLQSTFLEHIAKGFQQIAGNTEKDSLTEQKKRVASELQEMSLQDGLSAGVVERLKKAAGAIQEIQSETYLKNYIAVSVEPLKREVKEKLSFHNEHGTEYQTLLVRYQVLCDTLEIRQRHIFSYDIAGLTELKGETEKLQEEEFRRKEQSLIKEEIDDAMRSLGYDVIGSRTVQKKNGIQFRNELYQYADDSAINITYSSAGQITMELGMLDVKDRIPTAEEADEIRKQMNTFCEDFSLLEEELRKRGILVGKRIALLPPDTAFAQIINTADYEMKQAEDRRSGRKQQKARHLPEV